MRATLFLQFGLLLALAMPSVLAAQGPHGVAASVDSDGDGLSDALEQALLVQFAPNFQIGRDDCSKVPAEFRPGEVTPTVAAENGTIYGQVSPAKSSTKGTSVVEIHFYHLWKRDCGAHGHPLDTEHVAALVQASNSDVGIATWKALYWYAAAHEDTVCDVSQIARASTLGAEEHGAKVWVSLGKHASYLNEALCNHGCGADRCEEMTALPVKKLINLGEPGHPMHGAVFVSSKQWPLAGKMVTTNFPENPLARLNQLPETDIAWFNAGRHPAQQVIAVSVTTEGALALSGHDTSQALGLAEDSTGGALSTAEDSTGNALGKSYRKTTHAVGLSVRKVGSALHVTPKDGAER